MRQRAVFVGQIVNASSSSAKKGLQTEIVSDNLRRPEISSASVEIMKPRLFRQEGMAEMMNTTEAPLILIVNDEVPVRRSTGRFVRSLGMRAETFASAQDLLNAERLAEAACLILDVRMAKMDGSELQRRLKETRQRIPVGFISAWATREEEDRALRSGQRLFCASPSEGCAAARDSYGSRNCKVKSFHGLQ